MSNATKISTMLERYNESGKLQSQFPASYGVEEVKRLMLYLMGASNQVQRCSPETIYQCVLKAAHLDLSFDLGECHVVPYGSTATFSIDYKGLIKLAKRSGHVKSVKADVVRQGDEIHYQRGTHGESCLIHRPAVFSDEPIIGAYALFGMADGTTEFEVLSRKQIDAIRSKSSGKSLMWEEFFEEGAKKAAIRRGIKTLELYPDDLRAIIEDDERTNEFREEVREKRRGRHVSKLTERFTPKAIEHEEAPQEPDEEPVEALVDHSGGDGWQEAQNRLHGLIREAKVGKSTAEAYLNDLAEERGLPHLRFIATGELAGICNHLESLSVEDRDGGQMSERAEEIMGGVL